MATREFVIEVEEGVTYCDNCPIECDGRCSRDKFKKIRLDCDMYDLATMKIKELKENNESKS